MNLPKGAGLSAACLVLLLFANACSQPMVGGGLGPPGPPKVLLTALTAADGSPARVYPLIPIPEPLYPYDFVRAGVNGEVVVRLQVNAKGRVVEAAIVKGSHRELEKAVLVAMDRWVFAGDLPGAGAPDLPFDCTFKFQAAE